MLGMDKTRLKLGKYHALWHGAFIEESQRITNSCSNIKIDYFHIGSTAIEGVFAKPIIDIAIKCGADDLISLSSQLTALGYTYRGQFDNELGHYYAVLDKEGNRYYQLHIYTQHHSDLVCKLAFRDLLRSHASLAKEYSEYKYSLSQRITSKHEYAKVKDIWVSQFVQRIVSTDT